MGSKFKDRQSISLKMNKTLLSYNDTRKQTAGTLTHGLVYY